MSIINNNQIKSIPNIDDEDDSEENKIDLDEEDPDDDDELSENSFNDNNNTAGTINFDEKDEIIEENPKIQIKRSPVNSTNSSVGNGLDESDDNELDEYKVNVAPNIASAPGKSKFYLDKLSPYNLQSSDSTEPTEPYDLDQFSKIYFDEKLTLTVNNVTCLYSSLSLIISNPSKDVKPDCIKINGKLLLTNYRLIFIPSISEKFDSNRLFSSDKRLELFSHRARLSICIPFTFIFDIRAATVSNDKYRKLRTVLETSTSNVKEIFIRCKNFMSKSFTFSDKSPENTYKLLHILASSTNYQAVILNRFRYLIKRVSQNPLGISEQTTPTNPSTPITASGSVYTDDQHLKRKSYLTEDDLYEDLVECECDKYMEVKEGYVELIPNKFSIDTNMPFCAMPKNIADILTRRRVVVNESQVNEFTNTSASLESSNRLSTVSNSTNKKTNRLSEFLSGSPRSNKSSSTHASNTSSSNSSQTPILAYLSSSNPFSDNRFPVWSYTYPSSGCSLIVVPAPASNRADECEVIIRNYNSLLCDEVAKSKKQAPSTINVKATLYSNYEFYKLQVPFSNDKISSSYLRLMEICSYRSITEYYKDNESNTFYSRLHNTKWLRHVSSLLSLTVKIVNCLSYFQRNVFLEEQRQNLDCSCILTSLTKICLNPKYRTVVGLENLIQKEWFLAGHQFNKRMQSLAFSAGSLNDDDYLQPDNSDTNKRRNSISSMTSVHTTSRDDASNQDSRTSKSNRNEMTPSFLLFLDCLFQLTLQYPNEFEFNEFYLINMWDYSCSGLSFTFSFNGISHWLNFYKREIFLLPSAPVDNNQYRSDLQTPTIKSKSGSISKLEEHKNVFEANNLFWVNHLENNVGNSAISSLPNSSSNDQFRNKNYYPTGQLLLPCEKMYILKFWTRCYLRWNEKFHSYNSNDQELRFTSGVAKVALDENGPLSVRSPSSPYPSRPPPLPPKPKVSNNTNNNNNNNNNTIMQNLNSNTSDTINLKTVNSITELDKSNNQSNNKPIISITDEMGIRVTTRITPDGNIQSSF